ncbi:hypothetical protein Tco_1386523, partial [Tanacetum coccineum]
MSDHECCNNRNLRIRLWLAPVISICHYSSKETVGSHVPRVILFGNIPISILVIPVVPAEVPITLADPLVAPEVGVVSVISPTRMLDLVDYSSSSDYDPSEDSLPISPELPLVSLFLCSDDSEADNESEPAEQRHERHESLTPSSEFSLKPVVSSPGIRQRPAILVRPSEAIPFGRPNRTHPNWPRKLLTARKRDAMHQRSASLSTLYPLTTSETSLDSSYERSLDSSSPSAGPSRKRCRSLTTLVPSSTPILRSIAPSLADLPPRKRCRDPYSFEVSGEEHMEIGTADAETIADLGIGDGVGAHTEDGIGMGVKVSTSDIREDEEEFEAEASAGGTMEIAVDPMVPLDRITEFETAQRQLEAGQLVASEDRAGLADRVRSLGRENLRVRALLNIKRDRVDSLRRHMSLSQEEFHQ